MYKMTQHRKSLQQLYRRLQITAIPHCFRIGNLLSDLVGLQGSVNPPPKFSSGTIIVIV